MAFPQALQVILTRSWLAWDEPLLARDERTPFGDIRNRASVVQAEINTHTSAHANALQRQRQVMAHALRILRQG